MRGSFVAFGLAPLLAGCMLIPLGVSPQVASIVLRANFDSSDSFEAQAAKNTFMKDDVSHLKIDLYRGAALVATRDILNDALDKPIIIQNLKANIDYQVHCFAYRTVDESSPINLDDADSYTTIRTTSGTAATINPIKIKLIAAFLGSECMSNTTVINGVFLAVASESL